MKRTFVLTGLVLVSIAAQAVVRPVTVADSTITTVSGVGGSAEVAYAFAKGDKITLVAKASKPLESALVIMAPQSVLLRVKDSRKVNKSFVMPEDGTVIVRFISDRGGVNHVHYNLVRLPSSEAVQDYNTKAAQPANTGTMGR